MAYDSDQPQVVEQNYLSIKYKSFSNISSKKSKKESITFPAVENSDTQKKNNSQHNTQMDKPKN